MQEWFVQKSSEDERIKMDEKSVACSNPLRELGEPTGDGF